MHSCTSSVCTSFGKYTPPPVYITFSWPTCSVHCDVGQTPLSVLYYRLMVSALCMRDCTLHTAWYKMYTPNPCSLCTNSNDIFKGAHFALSHGWPCPGTGYTHTVLYLPDFGFHKAVVSLMMVINSGHCWGHCNNAWTYFLRKKVLLRPLLLLSSTCRSFLSILTGESRVSIFLKL